jgi:uncharacterized protein (TIGR02246 family)
MSRNTRLWTASVAVLAVAVTAGWLYRSAAQDKAPAGKEDSAEMAAVKKTAEEFMRAFNKGDAKAVAAFWTKDGEFVGADGEPVRGREAIEKSYAEFFKEHPKASVEVNVESVKVLGRYTALEEGTLKLTLPGEKEPGVSRYSVLHVKEEDGWRMASVREWLPDPAELVTLKDVEWLIGEWVGKSNEAEVRTTYAWDEDKAFLRCRYTVKTGDKVVASGTQMIGKDPSGGLRSWLFDSSGTTGDSWWARDEGRWVIEAVGTLPDGSEVTAVNVLIPLGKDAFTWQSVERTVAGTPVAGTKPLKVTRVKAEK